MNNLKSERVRIGMSQGELAAKIGVTKGAVISWEKNINSCKAVNLNALADIFGCTCDYLTGRVEERT